MAAYPFDVVTVPDFTGPEARRFEILTLFFLSSWIEYGGRSRALPLHIACIGDAPESVRFMANRCEAEITSHSPEPQGGFANKLRGFEVNRRTDHVLLLDSDMLVLSDLNDLPDRLERECIAASVANGPFPGSLKRCRGIYAKLGLPCPKNQVIPLNLELDTFRCVSFRDRKNFPPLYNGGAVYAPWRCELGEVWRDHLMRIPRVSPGARGRKGRVSNQPSLATAIAHLQQQGFNFQLLPDEYHVRWQHLATGAVNSREARLFHALSFARREWRGLSPSLASPSRILKYLPYLWKWSRARMRAKMAVEVFHWGLLYQTKMVRSHRGPATEAEQRASLTQIEDCHRLHGLMKTLYDKHVRELMR